MVGGVAEVVVTSVALRDLVRRPAALVRGPKWLWAPALFVQPVGSPLYLVAGRRSAADPSHATLLRPGRLRLDLAPDAIVRVRLALVGGGPTPRHGPGDHGADQEAGAGGQARRGKGMLAHLLSPIEGGPDPLSELRGRLGDALPCLLDLPFDLIRRRVHASTSSQPTNQRLGAG